MLSNIQHFCLTLKKATTKKIQIKNNSKTPPKKPPKKSTRPLNFWFRICLRVLYFLTGNSKWKADERGATFSCPFSYIQDTSSGYSLSVLKLYREYTVPWSLIKKETLFFEFRSIPPSLKDVLVAAINTHFITPWEWNIHF